MTDQRSSNPLAKRISMVECAGGESKPRLEITFATIEDMHAAFDFIRAAHEPETALDDHAAPERERCRTHNHVRDYCDEEAWDDYEERGPMDLEDQLDYLLDCGDQFK